MTKQILDVVAGDSWLYPGTNVRITYLGMSEQDHDVTGLEVTRLWCRREDTKREGWVRYGRQATVSIEESTNGQD